MPVRKHSSPDAVTDLPHPSEDMRRPDPPPAAPTPPMGTRTGATWVGICVGALVLVALVVFMMQNTAPVEVTFLGMHGSAPLALTLLIAGVGVGIIALVVGSLRIGQLKRRLRARVRHGAAVTPPSEV